MYLQAHKHTKAIITASEHLLLHQLVGIINFPLTDSKTLHYL